MNLHEGTLLFAPREGAFKRENLNCDLPKCFADALVLSGR